MRVWVCQVGRNVKKPSFFEAWAMARLHFVTPPSLCLCGRTNVFEYVIVKAFSGRKLLRPAQSFSLSSELYCLSSQTEHGKANAREVALSEANASMRAINTESKKQNKHL